MKLSEWAHAAEIASGLVVVVSVIVLIVEVRENTATRRLAAAQQVLGLSYSNNTLVAVDEGANELFSTISADGDLSQDQKSKYHFLLLSFFASHWQVYYQYQSGFLDRGIFDDYKRRTRSLLANRHAREWWMSDKFRFSEGYQDYVDSVLANDAGEEDSPRP